MFRSPKQTPALKAMLQDIGNPPPRDVALFLSVHERTVWNWLSQEVAPRPVMLALFHETRWGLDLANCTAVNDARLMGTKVRVLQAEVDRLQRRVAYLENLSCFDSANAPTFTPSPFWPHRPILTCVS